MAKCSIQDFSPRTEEALAYYVYLRVDPWDTPQLGDYREDTDKFKQACIDVYNAVVKL